MQLHSGFGLRLKTAGGRDVKEYRIGNKPYAAISHGRQFFIELKNDGSVPVAVQLLVNNMQTIETCGALAGVTGLWLVPANSSVVITSLVRPPSTEGGYIAAESFVAQDSESNGSNCVSANVYAQFSGPDAALRQTRAQVGALSIPGVCESFGGDEPYVVFMADSSQGQIMTVKDFVKCVAPIETVILGYANPQWIAQSPRLVLDETEQLYPVEA